MHVRQNYTINIRQDERQDFCTDKNVRPLVEMTAASINMWPN
jgi:hypothetical protein